MIVALTALGAAAFAVNAAEAQFLPPYSITIPAELAAQTPPEASDPPTPGVVSIRQYGSMEDLATFVPDKFLAVRFDPPFDPPYTISSVRFPSLTMDGTPAQFPRVVLVTTDPSGTIQATPLMDLDSYEGSANGWNEIPVGVVVTEPDKIFYLCVEFPETSPGFPGSYPFLRMDSRDMERGLFANAFVVVALAGVRPLSMLHDRNIIASMTCTLASPDAAPIEPGRAVGANWISSDTAPEGATVFSFRRPGDVRADGVTMQKHSLRRMDLLHRRAPWSPWTVHASGGPQSDFITVDNPLPGFTPWTVRAVDRDGRRSLTSNAVMMTYLIPGAPFSSWYDQYEPNGRPQDATEYAVPAENYLDASIFPAGDQDFYAISAHPGDEIQVKVVSHDPYRMLDLVLFLYDRSGTLLDTDDNSGGFTHPFLTYAVPPPSDRSRRQAAERFTLVVADVRGSHVQPNAVPRATYALPWYKVNVKVSRWGSVAVAPAAPSRRGREDGAIVELRGVGPSAPTGSVRFAIQPGASGTRLTLRLFDISGRLVRTLADHHVSDSNSVVTWDGRDHSGRAVSSGVYFAQLRAGGSSHVRRVVVLR